LEKRITFESDGMELVGILHVPDDLAPGERRAGFMVLHGFGSNKDEGSSLPATRLLAGLGYVTLRFDMRGNGDSGGARGRVLVPDAVTDALSARAFMAGLPEVDPARIGALGASYGAGVAVHAAARDEGLAAVIFSGGVSNGERQSHHSHATPEAWSRFAAVLEDARKCRDGKLENRMVNRYDIVPMPEHLRPNLGPKSIMEFHLETALSNYESKPEDVVAKLAPRPLLILHNARDGMIPIGEPMELYRRAGQPADLHIFAHGDHFMFADDEGQVSHVIADWLKLHFPARG
jgi:dipeptidyl aminopeptidase/acylaminoacyl peptidase